MESAFEKWKPSAELMTKHCYHNGRYWIVEDPQAFASEVRDAALEEAAKKIRERRDAYKGVSASTEHEAEQCLYIVTELKEQK